MKDIPRVKRFERNTVGNDYVVGDIHGAYTRLQAALDEIGFNPEVDRLFSVGDLVDRGPESQKVLEWLEKPWFHPVMGNHEDMAIRFARGHDIARENYFQNGGGWLMAMLKDTQHEYGVALNELPYAIEVQTAHGTVGIVHADIVGPSWTQFISTLESGQYNRHFRMNIMWSRDRIENNDHSGVLDIDLMVVGHTQVIHAAKLGNVLFIETVGWRPEGYFSIVKLTDMKVKN